MADDKSAAELKKELEDATPEEREAIVAAEQARENPRKTVLEAAGVDSEERTDSTTGEC